MSERFTITLLGGFGVHRDDQRLDLPPSCQRVIALAALSRREVPRAWMCSVLWPTSPPRRAVARLRTTLWRLRPLGADGLVVVYPRSVAVAPGVAVDWHDALDLIERLRHSGPKAADPELVAELLPLLRGGGLLEGWTEPWHVHPQRSYHAMRMAALDRLVGARVKNG
jgi:DNA-binding SARP family transcriptional activator